MPFILTLLHAITNGPFYKEFSSICSITSKWFESLIKNNNVTAEIEDSMKAKITKSMSTRYVSSA